jgi:hypothetical protein
MATRHQDPRQLAECLVEPIRRRIDDRVPTDSTSEHSRLNGQRVELTLFELDVRMCGAGDGKHRSGHVQADDIETVIRQESSHSPWPTPDIGNPTGGLSLDQIDEGHELGEVGGALCRRTDGSAYELGICLGRVIEDMAGGRYVVVTWHASRLRGHHPVLTKYARSLGTNTNAHPAIGRVARPHPLTHPVNAGYETVGPMPPEPSGRPRRRRTTTTTGAAMRPTAAISASTIPWVKVDGQ